MKYKLKPENKQVKKISDSKKLPNSRDRNIFAIIKAKPMPRRAENIKLIVGNCFFVNMIFSLLTKVSLPVARVRLAITTMSGTAIMVIQIITKGNIGICKENSTKAPSANPTLIPIQKTKFQNLFFVSHLLFIIAGFAALITGEVGRVVLDTFSGAASFVSAFSAAIYWFLYFTVPNFVKSFMSSCCNYWFKLYSFIVPKLECILKLIMQFVLAFTLCFQISNTMATPVKETVAEDVRALITKAERKYKIPFGLLTAIAKVESDMRSFAINVGGRSIFAASLAEATSAAKREIDAGKTNIDLGVMQLNWRWHGDQFSSLEEMLNPEKNIAYSARHLKQLYNQHGNWQKAIRYYHSAKPEYNRKYSRKVTMIWLASN